MTIEIKKVYYETGELWMETPYKNGKRNGIEKRYYISGKLLSETTWKDDQLHGIDVDYADGIIDSELFWKNDMLHGPETKLGASGDRYISDYWLYNRAVTEEEYREHELIEELAKL